MKANIVIFSVIINLLTSSVLLANQNVIKMATTTSTDNSGLLDYILPIAEQDIDVAFHTIVVGTGQALRLGENGDVDIVFVHAPDSERKFIASGFGVKRHVVMTNDFIVIGPDNDPANIRNITDVGEAYLRIKQSESLFISRGDNSGTHKKELSIWNSINVVPEGNWYREVGQSMGKVLQIANELQAYTMIDRGTWLFLQQNVSLKILNSGDDLLINTYSIMAVNPNRHPHVNIDSANQFIDFLISEKGQRLIGEYQINGNILFQPAARQ